MDIGRLLQGVLGSNGAATLKKEVGGLVGRGGAGGGSGLAGVAGGAAAGSLLTMVLGSKKGRKMGGTVLKVGGAAIVAGLAYKAYSDYRSNKAPQHEKLEALPDVPQSSGFALENQSDARGSDFRLAVIQAMVAAAKCDGHIDAEENARIKAAITEQNLSDEEKGFLLDAFSDEADPVAIANLAKTEAQAAELYVVSRMAIDPDMDVERRYLDRLAGALRLPQALVDHLDTKVEDARQQLSTQWG